MKKIYIKTKQWFVSKVSTKNNCEDVVFSQHEVVSQSSSKRDVDVVATLDVLKY